MTQLIGLTGGIASGKSTVAQILRTNMHVEVVDADVLAREAVAPKSAGLRQVVELFGDDVLRDDGTLDRPKVGAIVFADDEKRRALTPSCIPKWADCLPSDSRQWPNAATRLSSMKCRCSLRTVSMR